MLRASVLSLLLSMADASGKIGECASSDQCASSDWPARRSRLLFQLTQTQIDTKAVVSEVANESSTEAAIDAVSLVSATATPPGLVPANCSFESDFCIWSNYKYKGHGNVGIYNWTLNSGFNLFSGSWTVKAADGSKFACVETAPGDPFGIARLVTPSLVLDGPMYVRFKYLICGYGMIALEIRVDGRGVWSRGGSEECGVWKDGLAVIRRKYPFRTKVVMAPSFSFDALVGGEGSGYVAIDAVKLLPATAPLLLSPKPAPRTPSKPTCWCFPERKLERRVQTQTMNTGWFMCAV